jgi:hypothetical protein
LISSHRGEAQASTRFDDCVLILATRTISACAATITSAAGAEVIAPRTANWPAWRDPGGDGVRVEKNLPSTEVNGEHRVEAATPAVERRDTHHLLRGTIIQAESGFAAIPAAHRIPWRQRAVPRPQGVGCQKTRAPSGN